MKVSLKKEGTLYIPKPAKYFKMDWDRVKDFDEMTKVLSVMLGGLLISEDNKHFEVLKHYLIEEKQ